MKKKLRNKKKVDLFVALPYPYKVLHQGRIAGTFLPADIFKRYLKTIKIDAKVISGVDSYGTAVWLQARSLNLNPLDHVKNVRKGYLATLKSLSITPQIFVDTCDKNHRVYVRRHLKLKNNLTHKDSLCLYCENCNLEPSERLLWDNFWNESVEKVIESSKKVSEDLVCAICKKPPVSKTQKHSWLLYDPKITSKVKSQFPLGNLEEESKNITRYIPWGVSTGVPFQVYYVWVDALLTYAQKFRGERCYFFFGKDNLYYHALILRQLNLKNGPNCNKENTFVRNYILKDKEKLSNSKNSGKIQGTPLQVRGGLIISDPRTQDRSYGAEQRLLAKNLIKNKFENLYRRVLGFIKKRSLKPVVLGDLEVGALEKEYQKCMWESKPSKALEVCIKYHHLIVSKLELELKSKISKTSLFYYTMRLLRLLDPLFPKLKESFKSRFYKKRVSGHIWTRTINLFDISEVL